MSPALFLNCLTFNSILSFFSLGDSTPTNSLRRSAYPHQPYVDTLYVLPLRRRRPKLVLTGTSIPFYLYSIMNSTVLLYFLHKSLYVLLSAGVDIVCQTKTTQNALMVSTVRLVTSLTNEFHYLIAVQFK